MGDIPRWLIWAREIQALAQTGDTYALNDYQHERYQRFMEIAAEIVSEQSGFPQPGITKLYRSQIGYATPKIDVRGAVFSAGKILMVQERADGGWTLPGGWADVGDSPSFAVEREVQEESGFEVSARRLVGVYDANRLAPLELFHAYKLVFLCDISNGSPKTSNETSAVDFFGRDEIPAVLSGERTLPRHLEDVFACLADPGRPVIFD
jgi:ADP-ribose pyrophosphatase YjhB (NUDIX family)